MSDYNYKKDNPRFITNKRFKKRVNSLPKKQSEYKPYADKGLDFFVVEKEANPALKKGERQTSLGERLVADWLVKNGIRFSREKEFLDLINPMTGKRLIVDFYLHAFKTVIEFDGRQHYKNSKMFDRNGDSLEARIQRDCIKNDYCKKRGFKMIRIKYNEINQIDTILSQHFKNNR